MKKYILALVAVFTMSTTFAQMSQKDSEPQSNNERKTEMVQKRTDKMVKKYGLNEKQAKSLLALNSEYQGKIWMPGKSGKRMHQCNCPCCRMMMAMMQQYMQHGGMPDMQQGAKPGDRPCQEMNDSSCRGRMPMMRMGENQKMDKPCKEMNDSSCKGRMPMMRLGKAQKMDKSKMEENMKQRKAAREEYDTKLAKIMNKKQFAEYKANRENKQKKFKSEDIKQ